MLCVMRLLFDDFPEKRQGWCEYVCMCTVQLSQTFRSTNLSTAMESFYFNSTEEC